MELSKGEQIGIGIILASIGGFVLYKVLNRPKVVTTIVTTTATSSGSLGTGVYTSSGSLGTAALTLPSVFNGTWLNTYSGYANGSETATVAISADGTTGTYTIISSTPNIVRKMSNLTINAAANTVSFIPVNPDNTTAPLVSLVYNPTTNTFSGNQGGASSLTMVWTSVASPSGSLGTANFIGGWY